MKLCIRTYHGDSWEDPPSVQIMRTNGDEDKAVKAVFDIIDTLPAYTSATAAWFETNLKKLAPNVFKHYDIHEIEIQDNTPKDEIALCIYRDDDSSGWHLSYWVEVS